MVIDSSAVMAILLREPEAAAFAAAIERADRRLISAVNAGVIANTRRRDAGLAELDRFLFLAEIEVVPFEAHQVRRARDAYRLFGKGLHPAGLNLADCAAYALAKASGEPLLFKGRDFALTDVTPALP
jgi:ribonuclease VapC